jgi:hypothetical protein
MTDTHPPTDEQYAAIRAREAVATKGPWWADSHEIYAGQQTGNRAQYEWIGETCRPGEIERSEADARFIAAARTDVPMLLAEVDRLRAELAASCRGCYPHPLDHEDDCPCFAAPIPTD